jgi:hypothetical protein
MYINNIRWETKTNISNNNVEMVISNFSTDTIINLSLDPDSALEIAREIMHAAYSLGAK